MSKVRSHDPFRHFKHKLWLKIGQFDSRPLKVGNCLDFFACRWHVTYYWKTFDKSYNFVLDFISIEGLHTKLCARKVAGVATLGISGLALGSPEIKCHLGAGPVARHKIYYKGEGSGFPQVRAVVSLNLPMVRPSTKSV
jgi:hypothetical protein